LIPQSGHSARNRLIMTRRGAWIDKSLLPAVRRECLEILRTATREAVEEDTYIPGLISEVCEEVANTRPTPAIKKMEEEIDEAINTLHERGAFEGISETEEWFLCWEEREHISRKYEKLRLTHGERLSTAVGELWEQGIVHAIERVNLQHVSIDELAAPDIAVKHAITPTGVVLARKSCPLASLHTSGQRFTSAWSLCIGSRLARVSRKSASSSLSVQCCADRARRSSCHQRGTT